jgi:predicted dehydrogenase
MQSIPSRANTSRTIDTPELLSGAEVGDYRDFYANVRDAILDVVPLAVTAEDGFRAVRLLELAWQSSSEGRTLKVVL